MNKRNGKKLAELAPHQDPEDRVAIQASVPWGEEVDVIYLWRVEAHESNGSNGGMITFYVLTPGWWGMDGPVPDVVAAHRSMGRGTHEIDFVQSIAMVGTCVNDQRCGPRVEPDECANMTGRPIAPDIAALIASATLSDKEHRDQLVKTAVRENGAECKLRELSDATARFLVTFEGVFEDDWQHTLAGLGANPSEYTIRPDGTFLNPGVDDESNNWGNRGALLDAYRRLAGLLEKSGTRLPGPGEESFTE